MANAAVNDVIAVTLKSTLLGQTILSTFHYKITVLTAARTIAAFSNELETKLNSAGTFVDKYLQCCAPQLQLDETWVQFIRPVRYAKKVFINGVPGTNADDSWIPNISAVITKKGEAGNRRNIGSVHIPCPSSDNVITEGRLSVAYQLEMAVFGLQMITDVALFGDGTIAVPVIINALGQFSPVQIVNFQTQGTVRVMRRRTVGLGI